MRSGMALMVVAGLFACGPPKRKAGDFDAARTRCAAQPGFDSSESDAAHGRLRREGCRSTLHWSKCEDWWDRVVAVCSYREPAGTRIEVHSSLTADTTLSYRYREEMCDGVRRNVSATAPAAVFDATGKRVTTCGKRRAAP
ncbi:MAG: hypothetical protein L6Q84_20155 [Polyangiaceae bacterium]|nr:hypothetical protein [Polyangiaceae bacterium]